MHFKEEIIKTSEHREIHLEIGKNRESIQEKKIEGNLLAEWKIAGFWERANKRGKVWKQRAGGQVEWQQIDWRQSGDENQGRILQWWEEGAEQDMQHRLLLWNPKPETLVLNFFLTIPLPYCFSQPAWKKQKVCHTTPYGPILRASHLKSITQVWAERAMGAASHDYALWGSAITEALRILMDFTMAGRQMRMHSCWQSVGISPHIFYDWISAYSVWWESLVLLVIWLDIENSILESLKTYSIVIYTWNGQRLPLEKGVCGSRQ